MIIKKIWGELSYDSRKEKTIAVYVETEKGAFAGSAPEGKSTGKYEAPAFIGGVESVIGKINSLSEKIIKLNIDKFDDLIEVEKIVNKNNVRNPLVSGSTKSGLRLRTDMDKDFVGCGANAVIALESAILKALAADQKKEIWELINPKARKFPYPIGNVIGGGKHTELTKGSKPDFQEFLIIPQSDRFSENVDIMNEVHSVLKKKLKTLRARGKLNDEGAWSTSLNNEEVLRVLDDVRNDLILQTNKKISIGVDVAASSFYSKGDYKYKNQRKKLSKGD